MTINGQALLFERPAPGNRAVLVSVRFHAPALDDGDAHRDEFEELVRSAALTPAATVAGVRDKPHPRWFIGSGKADEVAAAIAATDATLAIFNHELAPAQQRNLEERLECRVMTRTELILHIFEDRARTHEGALQVELAQLRHAQTRLIRGWTHLDRQASGGAGGAAQRGTGETQLELDQRMLRVRVGQVRRRLDAVQQRRAQSRRRRSRARIPTVALAGYTNAGKSTLFNVLTGSRVRAEDRLFATLDPTMRRLQGSDADVILADTVGFIRALPVTLVEAFKATLEEVVEADLVLHVIDAAAADANDLREEVEAVLKEIGALPRVPIIEVMNKVDLVPGGADGVPSESAHERIVVSAVTGEGLDTLREAVCARLGLDAVTTEIRLPPSAGRMRSWLYRHGTVQDETVDAEGAMTVRVRLNRTMLSELDAGPLNASVPDMIENASPT
jgi:GTP-binding protein HflX